MSLPAFQRTPSIHRVSKDESRTKRKSELTSQSVICMKLPKMFQNQTSRSKKIKVGVIGTAGRSKSALLTSKLFFRMVLEAKSTIESKWELNWPDVELVSGGAAWSDHVALFLYQQKGRVGTSLTLYSPCKWDKQNHCYLDNGKKGYEKNPGKSANRYHAAFSNKMGYNTLEQIDNIISKPDVTMNCDYEGFHNRNTQVAKVDYLIAFSWVDNSEILDGGTKHTWNLCQSVNKLHICLTSLQS